MLIITCSALSGCGTSTMSSADPRLLVVLRLRCCQGCPGQGPCPVLLCLARPHLGDGTCVTPRVEGKPVGGGHQHGRRNRPLVGRVIKGLRFSNSKLPLCSAHACLSGVELVGCRGRPVPAQNQPNTMRGCSSGWV